MTNRLSLLGAGVVSAALVVGTPLAASAHGPSNSHGHGEGSVTLRNVISSKKGEAPLTDPTLQNMWGLAEGPDSSVWAANMGGKTSIILRGTGTHSTPFRQVTPSITVPDVVGPSGEVFNGTDGFKVGKDPARFLIAGLGGTITGWNTGTAATKVVSTTGAEYTGIDIINTRKGAELAATDFHNNRIDVFDSKFKKISTRGFVDHNLPAGYAPFNLEQIGDQVFVTYALQDANKAIDVPGAGHGFVDVYNTDGTLEHRLISRGDLSSPWGLTIAPRGWGDLTGKLLVGNLGDGTIHVYDPHSGRLITELKDSKGKAITVVGLWGLIPGNANSGGNGTIWFAGGASMANPNHGVVGTLTFNN
ncbi:TIGR03118 family protein [Actinoplanes sp. TBRC 11911]|uniref:TIGR03118 family protein n=1 Tax=Actinoplanes sp. TBRC 11911 TaxID=2729386 RepID=UPI00145DEE2B|nr:TIGR03118 family protein [Actinoplanes sp. TBRC 11911]NMO55103.1 TIGR03118 family protein [Actinoplanes sp. TBRC 11911]